MNKNKYFSVFLSYLLTLCMALSCATAAFADSIDANGTTVNQNLGDITVAVTGTSDGLGLDVTAKNGGTADIIAGSVEVQAADGSAAGVLAWGTTADSSVTVTIENGVTATSENNSASGAQIHATTGDTSVTVNGDVVTTGKTYASGVGASEGEALSLTVNGDVTATSDGGVSAVFAGRGDDVTVTVSGNVIADAGTGTAEGIYVLNDVVEGLSATVNVGGEVKAESDTGTAFGIYAHSEKNAESHVTTGSITATSGTNNATGILVQSSMEQQSADFTVNGDLTVKGGAEAVGVAIAESANTDITINGNVDVSGVASSSAYPVSTTAVSVARAQDSSVTVNGDVTAAAVTDGAEGVHVFANVLDGLDSTVTVSGNVTATSQHGEAYGVTADIAKDSEIEITIGGNVSANSEDEAATGISAVTSEDGETEITVDGTVSAESGKGSAYGVSATASTDGEVEVTVGKGINVRNNSNNNSTGITADATHDSEIEITVESGGVSVTSTAGQNSNGIYAYAHSGSEISMDITGDVRSEAESSTGILANSGGEGSSTDITVHGNVEAVSNPDTPGASYGIMAMADAGASTTVTVDGNVTATLAGIHLIATDDSSSGQTETILVNIGGDLTSGDYAIIVNDRPSNTAALDAVVAGTVHGDKGPIVVSPLVDADELTLTLWQVDIPEDGDIIKELNAGPGGEAASTEKTKEMEQNILYIIKVEEPTGASIKLNGTSESHGWQTAKEGETVTMIISVEEGYKLKGAYNGLGERIPLQIDKDGNYYVEVPRGGGVYLTAELNELFKPGQWWFGETAPVTVSFDFDGGKIGEDEGPLVIDTWIGNYIHLPQAPEKDGCTFAYWKEILPEEESEAEPLQYKAGQSLKILGDMRFIAVWEESETL